MNAVWPSFEDDSAGSALEGVRVLDLSRVLAGPYLTMVLGDLGADVLKVERPEGDDTRHWGPPHFEDDATYFLSVNRNKRSIMVDLRTEHGREQVWSLAREADIVIENFRPGVADRLGVGYERMRAEQPNLIYCSISAFGTSSKGRKLPGYDLLVQAVGGLMSVTGSADSGPMKAGVAVVDVLAGLHGLVGVLAALHHRDRTGAGQRVDVSLLGSLLASLVNQSSGYLYTGRVPGLMGNSHPSLSPYQSFQAEDGELVIAVGNDRQFCRLAEVLGANELLSDPRFKTNHSRVKNREELAEELQTLLSGQPLEPTVAALLAVGVPAGPVNDLAGAVAYAEDLGVPVRASGDDRLRGTVASPIQLSRTPVSYRFSPPRTPLEGEGATLTSRRVASSAVGEPG